MKSLATLVIAFSLILPVSTAFADDTTTPGQQKKEAGDTSAKEQAPGHHKEASGDKTKSHHKSKAHSDKAHADKTKGKTHAKSKTPDDEKANATKE